MINRWMSHELRAACSLLIKAECGSDLTHPDDWSFVTLKQERHNWLLGSVLFKCSWKPSHWQQIGEYKGPGACMLNGMQPLLNYIAGYTYIAVTCLSVVLRRLVVNNNAWSIFYTDRTCHWIRQQHCVIVYNIFYWCIYLKKTKTLDETSFRLHSCEGRRDVNLVICQRLRASLSKSPCRVRDCWPEGLNVLTQTASVQW